MKRYAAGTQVPVERTKAEIERTLVGYGASQFVYGWEQERALVGFVIAGRKIRLLLPMPNSTAPEVLYRDRGALRTAPQQQQALNQLIRQRWRAALLLIKAKLEAVTAGITTLESAFLAETVTPSGRTVYEETEEPLLLAFRQGKPVALLPPS